MSYDPNQPPYQQPQYPPQYPQPQKESSFSTGFKFVVGGCVALVVLVGGACVACSMFVVGVNELNKNATRSTPSNSATSNKPSETPKISLSQFNQIKDGMTYEQVSAIIGYGKLSSEYTYGKNKTQMYTWDAGLMKSVTCSFENNKLTSKTQFGLE